MEQDKQYMQRALELARLGEGKVAPNPMVGCVIVKDGQVIGEGWHQQYGQAHAERNAVASVSDKKLLKGSTVYVTLEPCSHYGKTPPCVDLLIEHEIGKVIIANKDPNPLVDGGGIKKLKHAGVQVETDILQQEGQELNREFFRQMNLQKNNSSE